MSEFRTIALTNQKGGVGKTTTTMHLGIGLANQGYRVLLIDGDPQANLTMSFGYEHPEDIPNNICGILRKKINTYHNWNLAKKTEKINKNFIRINVKTLIPKNVKILKF